MSRRRVAKLVVYTLFLLLIATTVRSMISDPGSVEAGTLSSSRTHVSTRVAYTTRASEGGFGHDSRTGEGEYAVRIESSDAGPPGHEPPVKRDDLIERLLRECISAGTCWTHARHSPDGGR